MILPRLSDLLSWCFCEVLCLSIQRRYIYNSIRLFAMLDVAHQMPALYCTALYCTSLYCTALYCTVLHCTALYCTVLHCTALYCTALHCTALYCTALYCTVLHCTVLHCTVLHFTVLHYTALYCTALYCTALYCTVLHCTVLHCTALYCTVLHYSHLPGTIQLCAILTYRFDEMRPGEPARKMSGKKRSFRDNLAGASQEKVQKVYIQLFWQSTWIRFSELYDSCLLWWWLIYYPGS